MLACGFLALGLSSLPHDLTAEGSVVVVLDRAGAGTGGIGAPVFVLRESGAAVRFGTASVRQDGTIRIGFYDPLDPLLAYATEAVSLPADPRLLWLLASPEERQSVREAVSGLARVLPQTALAMLNSPEFTLLYRDRLAQRFRADLEHAWQVTQASGAWQDLMRGVEPILRDAASRELRPIIENRFRSVPMRMLRANALQLIDPFHETRWNMGPVEDALQAAFVELRERGVPERTVARVLATPAVGAFLGAFADALARELAHDAPLRETLSEMVTDERFRPYLGGLIARTTDLARVAPRLLVSLHGSTDLNPVASFLIRTLAAGRTDRVVVFMSPAQRDAMLALDPEAVLPIAQAVRG